VFAGLINQAKSAASHLISNTWHERGRGALRHQAGFALAAVHSDARRAPILVTGSVPFDIRPSPRTRQGNRGPLACPSLGTEQGNDPNFGNFPTQNLQLPVTQSDTSQHPDGRAVGNLLGTKRKPAGSSVPPRESCGQRYSRHKPKTETRQTARAGWRTLPRKAVVRFRFWARCG
jgi:hypothetical protein